MPLTIEIRRINKLLRVAVLLTLFYSLYGCIDDRGRWCTAVKCSDSLIVKVTATESYTPGRYTAELIFSDEVSIQAEFEIVEPQPEGEDESGAAENASLMAIAISNETFPISWSIVDELPDYIEIAYYGEIPSDDTIVDYAFTSQMQFQIRRDETVLVSETITPDFEYYWCNQEAGKCDPRQNKRAQIEMMIH